MSQICYSLSQFRYILETCCFFRLVKLLLSNKYPCSRLFIDLPVLFLLYFPTQISSITLPNSVKVLIPKDQFISYCAIEDGASPKSVIFGAFRIYSWRHTALWKAWFASMRLSHSCYSSSHFCYSKNGDLHSAP